MIKTKEMDVNRIRNIVCLLMVTLLLSGCESQLYTGLNEREGNDMLALLLDSGISATKELNKDRQLTLFVPNDDVARSIHLLRSNGYPRDNFSSVSEIFPKEGLISSPIEERARYTYSMSQELSSTLSMIDGVITARVHVVLPQEQTGAQENPYPSSAAVFIKYSPDLVLSGFIPKVKTLVSNSIEGLSLDKITVTLFPSGPVAGAVASSNHELNSQELDSILTVEVSPESKNRLVLLMVGMLVLVLLAFSLLGAFIWMFIKNKKRLKETNEVLEAVPEDLNTEEPNS